MDINLHKSIIKVAERLFTKYGIKSIKVDDICAELHMSKKTFYAEFENKEELIEVVYSSIVDKSPTRFDLYNEIENCENAIDIWLKRPSMEVRAHHKKYEIFMYDLLKYYPQIHANYSKVQQDRVKLVISTVLKKGIQQGLFREDMDINQVVDFSLDMSDVALNKLIKLPKSEHVGYVRFLFDLWVRSVCSEKGMIYYLTNYENGIKKQYNYV